MPEYGKRQGENKSARVGGNYMRQLVAATIAWLLLSPLSFSQKEYQELDDVLREQLDLAGRVLDKAGETWLATLEQSAEVGHVASQGELCQIYSWGVIFVNNKAMRVPEDYSRALLLCRNAAEQSDVGAQYQLGKMHYRGKGVPKNYTEAFKWYLKAAMRGLQIAQSEVGLMYSYGRGVLQDFVKAYAWLNLAAAHGEDNLWLSVAVSERDRVRKEMTPTQVAEAQKLAAELLKRIESANSD